MRLEVRARAERAALAPQHRHPGRSSALELAERVGEIGRGGTVHRVAGLGAGEDDRGDVFLAFDPDRHR